MSLEIKKCCRERFRVEFGVCRESYKKNKTIGNLKTEGL